MMGYLPTGNPKAPARLMRGRDDAAVAKVLLEAAGMIMERGYPAKRYAGEEIHDPMASLAAIFGMTPEELEETPGFMGFDHAADA